jgi:hypothetical protein
MAGAEDVSTPPPRARPASSRFGQPSRFAGDFRQSEQRLFQLGLRFEF